MTQENIFEVLTEVFVLGISFYSLTLFSKVFYLHCLRNSETEEGVFLDISLKILGTSEPE